ncbi:Cyclin-U3-1 [Diplonema papillatum]|nr:Cyclin-U3-1 [Diplonema papillatum]
MSGIFNRRRKSEGSPTHEEKTSKPPSSPKGLAPQSSSPTPEAHQQHKTRRATIYDNLFYPVATHKGSSQKISKSDQHILDSAEKRRLFMLTPTNTHLDVIKDKNELDYLLDKYQPEFEQIVPSLCDALNAVIVSHTLASRRKSVMSEENKFVSYDTSTVPDIQLEDYLWRICDYTYISPTTLLMACIYIDRLILEGLILSQLNVFKLFFTSVRVASKVHELRSLSNKNFAVVGGVTTDQMNQLESLFMRDFKWRLWVDHEQFVQYCQRLMPPGEIARLPPIGK